MKKFALALMLALSFNPLTVAASTRRGGVRSLPFDGVNRRTRANRTVRGKTTRRAQTRQRRPEKSDVGAGDDLTKLALPVVTEIDGEGLKKLLERGEAGAARPLLINFWATWCVPCRKEFPDLVKIDRDYRGRGLEFVVISADDVSELKADVPKFLRGMRAGMPAYLLNATDTEAAIAQVDPTWGGELPATFLFDRAGKLVFKHTGLINAVELRAEIEKAVASDK